MNLFTQTVDSSLWSSRAYDDATYDLRQATPYQPVVNLTSSSRPCLVVLTASCSTALLNSHFPSPLEHIGAVDNTPILSASDDVAVVVAPAVPDENARSWALALLSSMGSKRVVVLTTLPSFRLAESIRNRTAFLGEAKGDVNAVPLQAPAMLEGVAAAVVCEAVMDTNVHVAAYIEAREASGYGGDTLERLSVVIDCEMGIRVDAAERRARELRHREAMRDNAAQGKAVSIYT